MSIFEQAYDEMSWQEVCYRLPGDLAINALRRRITNLDTLKMFFEYANTQPSSMKALREHVNDVLLDYTPEEIFEKFPQEEHPLLFNWTDSRNKTRLKEEGKDKLTHKFLFNLAESDDVESLTQVLDHVLAQDPIKASEVLAVMNKIDKQHFVPMFHKIISDPRPEVKALTLSINSFGNNKLISRLHKTIALKAICKLGYYDRAYSILDFSIFSELKPLERLKALSIYLNRFPRYQQLKVFNPMPTEDELNLVLFAGCIEHNEEVQRISKLFKEITQEEPPKSEEDDEEEV